MKIQKNEKTCLSSNDEKLTLNSILALFQETDKKIRETGRLLRQNQEMTSDLEKKSGAITGYLSVSDLKERFSVLGFDFEKSSSNVRIGSKTCNIYTEINLFLENSGCALAIEVKNQLNMNDVWEHIERMEDLRRYFDLHDDRRKLYGALTANVIPGSVLDFALKQGFYIIKRLGGNVEEPEGRPKAW
jgi:hypothetical protein